MHEAVRCVHTKCWSSEITSETFLWFQFLNHALSRCRPENLRSFLNNNIGYNIFSRTLPHGELDPRCYVVAAFHSQICGASLSLAAAGEITSHTGHVQPNYTGRQGSRGSLTNIHIYPFF
jgi:hypothetical protein